MRKIIGLMGVKGSGKDTAASALIAVGFRRLAFADLLYQEAAQAFNFEVAQLGARDTKETDTPALALENCKDPAFIGCALAHLGFKNADSATLAKQMALPRSPRVIMQQWGTEYRRKGYPGVHVGEDSYWINSLKSVIDASPAVSFVITDVRFKNEYTFVKALHGSLVRVCRPVLEAKEALDRAQAGTAAHPSETDLLGVPVDFELFNLEGQLGSLHRDIVAYAAQLDEAQLV